MSGTAPSVGRLAEAALPLTTDGPALADARFALPDPGAREVRLDFVPQWSGPRLVRLQCEGRGMFIAGDRQVPLSANRARAALVTADAPAALHWRPETGACTVQVGHAAPIHLSPETEVAPQLSRLALRADDCPAGPVAAGDPLAALLQADHGMVGSCVLPAGETRLLLDGIEALQARLAALLGYTVPRAALLQGNPDMALDFSRAPDLDLIAISSLFLRADVQGSLIGRALEHHARQGAEIRIAVNEALSRGLDRAFLDRLAARFPRVQVQYFTWPAPRLGDTTETLHRVHHAKVFLTLGADPAASRAIIGGRNLHDGYFYNEPFDLSAWPDLQDYTDLNWFREHFFVIFEDLDVELRDPAMVQSIAAQTLAFWHRDARTLAEMAPATVAPPRPPHVGEPMMRHFISRPWADGGALERAYVNMIDAARDDILIFSEFFYPPPSIEAALVRAAARGVRVRVVVMLTSPEISERFVTALTGASVARHAGRFEFYAYQGSAQLMHVKMLVIDHRLSVTGSVNFNRRTYYHDTENLLVALDPGFAARLERLADGLIAQGEPQAPGQPVPWLAPVLQSWTAMFNRL
ncbi:phospholipase D-like domain-containing protein [Roseicyclus elongatus]|nr:phosphatidylserine/phosphatidylglycerophosphate/cardiolipin synthase family protein [Roseibacterium elongatum]